MWQRMVLAILAVTILGCGYSEDEWQAQLAKYEALAQKNAATEAELDQARQQVALLEAQLAEMGIKVQEMDGIRAALDDYKKRADTLERIKARFEALRQKLEQLTNLGLKVEIRRNRMVISLPGDVLFASGRDKLRDEGRSVLERVAEVIRNDPDLAKRHYQVAGHTDDKPLTITRGVFRDNWGLSLMRAREVLVFLTTPGDEKGGGGSLNPSHWSASGYGETDPVVPNTDDDSRQKNRRVELILMPDVEEMLDLRSFI